MWYVYQVVRRRTDEEQTPRRGRSHAPCSTPVARGGRPIGPRRPDRRPSPPSHRHPRIAQVCASRRLFAWPSFASAGVPRAVRAWGNPIVADHPRPHNGVGRELSKNGSRGLPRQRSTRWTGPGGRWRYRPSRVPAAGRCDHPRRLGCDDATGARHVWTSGVAGGGSGAAGGPASPKPLPPAATEVLVRPVRQSNAPCTSTTRR